MTFRGKQVTRMLAQRTHSTTVTCRCGDLDVRFHDVSKPLYSLECCCVDCYQKNAWSAWRYRKDRALPNHGDGSPLRLSYFPNRFSLVSKHDRPVKFNKIRKHANSTNMISTCCETLMCVDHPSYKNKQVLTFPEFVNVVVNDNDKEWDPVARVWVADWPEDALKVLRSKRYLPELYFDYDEDCWSGLHSDRALAFIADGKASVSNITVDDSVPTTTFQELCDACETGVQILSLPELEGSHRKKHAAMQSTSSRPKAE